MNPSLVFALGAVLGAAVAWAIRSEMAGRAALAAQRHAFASGRAASPQEYERWKEADAFKPTPPPPPPPNLRPWETHPDFENIEVDDEGEAEHVVLVDYSGGDGYGRVMERVPRADWNARWNLPEP